MYEIILTREQNERDKHLSYVRDQKGLHYII